MSLPVMLSAAKYLAADRDRPCAALRVTWCDESHGQGFFFTIDPRLNKLIRPSVGADYVLSKIKMDYRRSSCSAQTDFIIRIIFWNCIIAHTADDELSRPTPALS